ncbi:phosphatidic acid phosphatase [Paenarthrobacter sp. AR 02]|uniref:phosphatase PAP2 family protein n=1 Tax=unclassified Paenarthrobacter TaxID=2634190 RepID=UPI001F1B8DCD|nr:MULTISPECIES: phosphatase PAP2 family protein [unclassified Paenarthrobacter]MCF3140602.1 phosphatidic acid phosphatase [Paenarthrobacter sp. AR 02]MCR1162909.1 phosphatidic acid phosphatase [Paenarthrobacter sp. UW852]
MAGPWRTVARVLTEVFQPPVVVLVLLLISPAVEPGFPGTIWFGLLGAFFVCVVPLAYVLVMVKLGRITDHHVSDRRQRPALLLMALVSVVAGLVVLQLLNGPASVSVMIISLIGGIAVLAVVSAFWKMSGHASALSAAVVIAVLMFGPAWLPLLLLVPAVGWSRLVLRAHTLAQVVVGSLFGAVVIAGLWWLLRGLML